MLLPLSVSDWILGLAEAPPRRHNAAIMKAAICAAFEGNGRNLLRNFAVTKQFENPERRDDNLLETCSNY
jgi:hypothetical protein